MDVHMYINICVHAYVCVSVNGQRNNSVNYMKTSITDTKNRYL